MRKKTGYCSITQGLYDSIAGLFMNLETGEDYPIEDYDAKRRDDLDAKIREHVKECVQCSIEGARQEELMAAGPPDRVACDPIVIH